MHAEQEQRHVYYDHDLGIEAYNLSGIVQKFPNHFHDYYVIGFVEGGKRHLWCKGMEYDLNAGDLILFNPRDNHFCAPINGEILDYRAVNINMDVMQRAVKEITGKDFIPHFTENVVYQSDITQSIGDLYDAILAHEPKLKKEEAFFFLLQQILQEHAAPFDEADISEPNQQIKTLCSYMEEHFSENITLENRTCCVLLPNRWEFLRTAICRLCALRKPRSSWNRVWHPLTRQIWPVLRTRVILLIFSKNLSD